MKTRAIAILTPALASLAFAVPAGAATSEASSDASSGTSSEAVSENWAGYEATTSNASGFSAVSGSWVQPTVSAASGQSYSAYWVGLGGGDANSDALEQEGTQADVSASGKVTYYAWYELVPSAPVKIPVAVKPGDSIYARTVVEGDRVTVTLDNRSTGQDYTKTLTMTGATPDTSTAEWVAEAPSECQGGTEGNCEPLSLADFGSVKFSDAHARSDGQVKSISGWNAQAIELSPEASGSEYLDGGGYGGGFGAAAGTLSNGTTDSEGAAPGGLSADGSAFTVTYGAETSSSGGGSSDGSGYSDGYGYGDSGYGDSGYGDGSAAGEGGSSGYGGYGGYGGGSSSGYGDAAGSYPGYGYSGYGYGLSGYGLSGDGESVYSLTGGTGDGGYTYVYGTPYVLGAAASYAEAYYGNGNGISTGYGV